MTGIAGFGSAGIYFPEKGFHKYLDFHAPSPAAARPDMWEHPIESEARDGYGFILKGKVNDVGYQSTCVPASLKAYFEAHSKLGVLPWRDIVAPAIEWADRGWMIRTAGCHLHRVPYTRWERFTLEARPRSIYMMSGPSREVWEHSIPTVEAQRYSITFRTMAAKS
jgi:gamma-glutamyltranspeptidase